MGDEGRRGDEEDRGPGAAHQVFGLMEGLLEKLKVLNYEEEVLAKHNMKNLSRWEPTEKHTHPLINRRLSTLDFTETMVPQCSQKTSERSVLYLFCCNTFPCQNTHFVKSASQLFLSCPLPNTWMVQQSTS